MITVKKLWIVLIVLMVSVNGYCTEQWKDGTGAETVLGSINPGTIDSAIYDNIVAPLDNFLADGRFGCKLAYSSASELTVGIGSVVCSNTSGSIRLMARNSSATTVDWDDLDTGSEAASTTYYVYAVMSAVSDTTFTIKVSESSSLPSGVTYYLRLGYFTNDSDSNISLVTDDVYVVAEHNHDGTNSPVLEASGISGVFGDWDTSKSNNTIYQASTDGFVIMQASALGAYIYGYTDSSSSPTTVIIQNWVNVEQGARSLMFPVKKDDYWKVTGCSAVLWIPIGS